MKYSLIIFDLDGTILDTLGDLTDACNAALEKHGYPTHTSEEVRTFIGNGVSSLIRLALPEGTDSMIHREVLADFKAWYFSHLNIKTRPYPGIPEMLRKLRETGIHVAVNSNKIDPATCELCRTHFAETVEFALGEREGVAKKPNPAGAKIIMEKFGALPENTLYVGDSSTDLETAANAGLDCAWVSWGFRHRSELGDINIPHAFDDIESLESFLLQ